METVRCCLPILHKGIQMLNWGAEGALMTCNIGHLLRRDQIWMGIGSISQPRQLILFNIMLEACESERARIILMTADQVHTGKQKIGCE